MRCKANALVVLTCCCCFFARLHDAAKFGHAAVVKLLLEHGANADIKNKNGKTAKEIAEQHAKDSCVSLLKAKL